MDADPDLLVTSIGIVSAIVLARNDALGKNVLRVNVTAQQFAWSFSYPDAKGLTSGVLRLPVDRSVQLTLTLEGRDPLVLGAGVRRRSRTPSRGSRRRSTSRRTGSARIPVICTELCGLGHALMRTEAIVMTPEAFDEWLRASRRAPRLAERRDASGAAVFKNQACGACHALKAAGASANVGPDLDKLPAVRADGRESRSRTSSGSRSSTRTRTCSRGIPKA